MTKNYYIYILANKKNGTIYTGVTNNLEQRTHQHKNNLNKGFTNKYKVKKSVYYEICEDIVRAIDREKQIKSWKRKWKLDLIEKDNPHWNDLHEDFFD